MGTSRRNSAKLRHWMKESDPVNDEEQRDPLVDINLRDIFITLTPAWPPGTLASINKLTTTLVILALEGWA